jgi:hypothetical protein
LWKKFPFSFAAKYEGGIPIIAAFMWKPPPVAGILIDICINNVIMEMLCSPLEPRCPDPEEVPISWKTGVSEL